MRSLEKLPDALLSTSRPEENPSVSRRGILVIAGGVLTTHLIGCASDGGKRENASNPGAGGVGGSGGGSGGASQGQAGVGGSGGTAGGGNDPAAVDAGSVNDATNGSPDASTVEIDSGGGVKVDATPMMPNGKPVDCVMRAEQTEGPFAENNHSMRADIRGGKAGIPLKLVLRFGRVAGQMCNPFEAAVVDIWQCDAAGVYSGPKAGLGGQDFLRGYQLTDKSGTVEFQTIYPGSYPGRPVHIHFSVRLQHGGTIRRSDGSTFVSQLYFPEDLTADLLQDPAYRGSAQISRNSSADLPWILKMEKDGAGYRGLLDIGVQLT